jgi:hypothetical protein
MQECLPDIKVINLSTTINKVPVQNTLTSPQIPEIQRKVCSTIELQYHPNITSCPLYSSVIGGILRAAINYVGHSSYFGIDDYLWCEVYTRHDIEILKELIKKYGIEYVYSVNLDNWKKVRDDHFGMSDTIQRIKNEKKDFKHSINVPINVASRTKQLIKRAKVLFNLAGLHNDAKHFDQENIMTKDSFITSHFVANLIAQYGIKIKNVFVFGGN